MRRGKLLVRAMRLALVITTIVLVSGVTARAARAFDEGERSHMRQQLVEKFCEQTEWLTCFGEQPTQCAAVVSRFIKPCLERNLDSSAGPITDAAEARRLSLNVIKCFNTEFEMTHPMGKVKSLECANAPAHLQ